MMRDAPRSCGHGAKGRLRRLALLLAALGASACATGPGNRTARSGPATAESASTGQAYVAVQSWLEALRAKHVPGLEERTQFPFAYTTTNVMKQCEGQAPSVDALAAIVQCLSEVDELFLEALAAYEAAFDMKVVPHEEIPPELRSIVTGLARTDVLVHTYVPGDAVLFDLLFAVGLDAAGEPRVRALFLDKSARPE